MQKLFHLGTCVVTRGVAAKHEEDIEAFSKSLLDRHSIGDWGDVCKEDAQANETALACTGRLMSVYHVEDAVYWIITEWDRSATTIMFPEEY